MKTITPETRDRIFALYWGLEIAKNKRAKDCDTTNFVLTKIPSLIEEFTLQVKSLSTISEEHENELSNITGIILVKYFLKEMESDGRYNINAIVAIKAYQYLLSKGYALPYDDYTVEDLVELGVYELKNNIK